MVGFIDFYRESPLVWYYPIPSLPVPGFGHVDESQACLHLCVEVAQ